MKALFQQTINSRWAPWLFLLFIFVVGIAARLTYPMSFHEWIDRDVQRAIGIAAGEHFPLVGPETNNGGFLPGPFFYVMLSPLYIFTRSPYAIGYLNGVLNIASIILFFLIIRKRYSPFGVLVSMGLLCFSTMHASSFGSPINPSFIFIFNSLMILFILKIFVEEKDNYFLPATLTIALVSQIHLSFAAHLLSLLVLSIFVRRPRFRVLLTSTLSFVLALTPFFVYLFLIRGVPLFRSYQQFETSQSFYSFVPFQALVRLFWKTTLDPAYARATEIIGSIHPSFVSGITRETISFYILSAYSLEVCAFVLAVLVSVGALVVWGYRLRLKFTANQRKWIVPFLAVLPILLFWQLGGIARHGHDWYSYIFFPLVPLWIGASFELVASWLKVSGRRVFQCMVLIALLFLVPKTTMYYKSVFYILDDVALNVIDMKKTLSLTLERFKEGIFFVDRPSNVGQLVDPPFPNPPWGLYTDYLYSHVGTDINLNNTNSGRCHLVAHRPTVATYSLDFYLKNIRKMFGIDVDRVFSSDRLVYFEYTRPDAGNCFHNTTNAWVVSERMGRTIGRISSGHDSMIIRDQTIVDVPGRWNGKELEVAVFDRTAMLPISVKLSIEKNEIGYFFQSTLESAQLMGHLNTKEAYSGLFRPWAKLWLEDVEVVFEVGDEVKRLRFSDGEVGKYMVTPLSTRKTLLKGDLEKRNLKVTLQYKTVVSGQYEGGGKDIQELVVNNDEIKSWKTAFLLYEGQFAGID